MKSAVRRARIRDFACLVAIGLNGCGLVDCRISDNGLLRKITIFLYVPGIKDMILVPPTFERLGLLHQGVRFNSLVPNI